MKFLFQIIENLNIKIFTVYICIGYSPSWRQLWAYIIREIIGRGHSLRPIISSVLYAHNCLQQGLYVFHTLVTEKYAIKSHLTSLLSNTNHSIVLYQFVFTVKTVKIQLDCG